MRAAPILVALLIVGLAAASPPAHALFGDDEARRAIIELRARIELQSRETTARLTEFGARIDALAQRIERFEQSSRGQLELNNQIELLRQEIARLRGQLEVKTNELAGELAQTQLRQKNQFGELDARVRTFEPVSVSFEGRNVNVDPEEKRLYEGSLAALRDGEFATAAGGFASLRQRWPASPYAPLALYWSGSAQFALKDFRAALASDQRFVTRHPEHPRVPDALLAQGLCELELGDKRNARRILELLLEKHPNSPAAGQARERLPALR
jgi:tol-pal system protein YbgF